MGFRTKDKVDAGSKAPTFTLPSQSGEMVSLEDFIGTKPVVLFFYPKDDTPGCTKEVCAFRDRFEGFRRVDAEVIGISSDSVDSHDRFAAKHDLPFTLLSDEGGKVRRLYGVPNAFGLFPGSGYLRHRRGEGGQARLLLSAWCGAACRGSSKSTPIYFEWHGWHIEVLSIYIHSIR